jgi:hypothetical protein
MKQLLLYICLVSMLTACYKKEDSITPATEDQGYKVPQGNHGYDDYIVNFYKKYGKYLLYEFTDKDVYWTPTAWKVATFSNGVWFNGPEMVKADTTYVGDQLKLMDTTWFRYYSDAFLKTFLPVKIMLCKSVDSVYLAVVSLTPVTLGKGVTNVASWFNYDNISVNYGNATAAGLTPAQVKKVGAKLHLVFMQSINERKMVTATSSFGAIANYTSTLTTPALAYQQGIIYPYNSSPSANLDWAYFMIAMVSMNETALKTSTAATNTTFWGILNATKDTNGRIRQRYNMVRNYYITNYNVDLQAIGNTFN